jgi:hypothetical protein
MTAHAVVFLVPDRLSPKGRKRVRIREHRPRGEGAVYRLVRREGDSGAVTDEDFEAVGNCLICYPRRRKPVIDRGRR